jgi:hypothetical protein
LSSKDVPFAGGSYGVPLAFVMITAEIGREGEVLSELTNIEHVKEAFLTYGGV